MERNKKGLRNMKVAFLTPEYPHPKIDNAAGIGTSIKNLAIAMADKGHQITIFVYGQRNGEIINEDKNISIHLIPSRKYIVATWFFYRNHIQNYVNKVISQEEIEILEAPDWTGITAFMNFKIPLVIRFHGSDTYFCHLEKRKQKLKNYCFEKIALLNADGFIAPTSFAGELSAKLFRISKKNIKTIHYGLQLEQFLNPKPEQFDKELVLYIGTIIRKKGVFELPEIFKIVQHKFPNSKLILIGNDSSDIATNQPSTWELLKNNLEKNDLKNVSYLGKIPYEQVQEYIKKAHVCVFPTYAETLGMVTIESMALQKPVINSDFGWAKELIENENSGFLVYPNDHKEFAQRIIDLFEDQNLCKEIGGNARKVVEEKFDINLISDQNIHFYQSVISASL
jgi:L-malate glycosyltransferase